jgi:hypothetical protein
MSSRLSKSAEIVSKSAKTVSKFAKSALWGFQMMAF